MIPCISVVLVIKSPLSFPKIWNASGIFMPSMDGGNANLLCLVPVLAYVLHKRCACLMGIEFEFCLMKRVLEKEDVMAAQQRVCT